MSIKPPTGRTFIAGKPRHGVCTHALLAQLSYGGSSGDTHAALLRAVAEVPPGLWGAQLGLKLLKERALHTCEGGNPDGGEGDSAFGPYLDALPRSYPAMPMFQPVAAADELQFPAIRRQAVARSLPADRPEHKGGDTEGDEGAATAS